MKSYIGFLVLFAAFVGVSTWYFFSPSDSAASGVVIVSGDTAAAENEIGWMLNRDPETATAVSFVSGVGNFGTGSLYAGPITNTNFNNIVDNDPNNDKFVAEYFPGNVPVANFNSFSYDAKIETEGASNLIYLNIYTNIDASDNFFDCRYDYVFTTVSTASFNKHVVYPGIAPSAIQKRGDRITACPAVLEDMPASSTIRAIALNMGDTTASDTGLSAYFDNVEVIFNNEATYFNFEPLPQTKEDCQKDGWARYGFKNQGQCMKSI